MINLKNITAEMKTECGAKAVQSFDSVSFAAIELLRTIMDELPPEAVLIGANVVNACRRDDPEQRLDMTPRSYIVYILDGYIVELEFGHFWIFEGVRASAYPVTNGKYRTTRYGVPYYVEVQGRILELIKDAKNPKRIYDKMDVINDDLEYTQTDREATGTIYIG